MTMLRQVLAVFESQGGSLTLNQMAKQLRVEPGMLESMIDYWIRKGKIRETSASEKAEACHTCGTAVDSCGGCPFVMQMPRRYELITADTCPGADYPQQDKNPPLRSCCH